MAVGLIGLYTPAQVCYLFDCDAETIYEWRRTWHFPDPIWFGNALKYRATDIDLWLTWLLARQGAHSLGANPDDCVPPAYMPSPRRVERATVPPQED